MARPRLSALSAALCVALALGLTACDEAPADPPEALCDALPGAVDVDVDGDRWCAHHDVARFTCPDALPHRGAFGDVAFCGPRPVDDAIATDIARAALRTGGVLARRGIVGFVVPRAWTTDPGAPSDTVLDIEASTVTASNTSWATADGDPFLCVRDGFAGFEVELDGADRVQVTAWDHLRCDPDALGYGVELHETLPLTLPGLPPGRYTLGGAPTVGDPTRPAPLVVAMDAVCPDDRPLSSCFRGHVFAECGATPDAPAPGIWCDAAESFPCVWAACPPAAFRALECAGDPFCPNPHMQWGPEPWDRERDMALAVEIDAELDMAPPSVDCEIEHIERDLDRVCGPEGAEFRALRSPGPEAADWGWPSLLGFTAFHQTNGLSTDRILMVEADVSVPGRLRARACLIEVSDGGASGAPVCAAAGTLTLDRLPASAEDVPDLAVRLRAEFADFELAEGCPTCGVRGLVIDARL